MTFKLIKLIKRKYVLCFLFKIMLLGKKITLPFFVLKYLSRSAKHQHDFMISNDGPRKAGSGEAVEKEINGEVFKGIISIEYIKQHHYTSEDIKRESRVLYR